MKNCSHFAYTNNLHHTDFDLKSVSLITGAFCNQKIPSFNTLVYLLTTNMIALHSF